MESRPDILHPEDRETPSPTILLPAHQLPKVLKSSFSNASYRWLNMPTISSASDRGTPQLNKLIASSAS
jgi:hypothetical protein